MTNILLTSENVEAVFMNCLFQEVELAEPGARDTAVLGEGTMLRCGFHPGRLAESRETIAAFIEQIPVDADGTFSFLTMCNRSTDGIQWGEHRNMDQLASLATAASIISSVLPRELWPMLPGGMPVFSTVRDMSEILA